jgi:hypothetical protein
LIDSTHPGLNDDDDDDSSQPFITLFAGLRHSDAAPALVFLGNVSELGMAMHICYPST